MNARKMIVRDSNGTVNMEASTKKFVDFVNMVIAHEAVSADQTVAALINVFRHFNVTEMALNALATYTAVEMQIAPNEVSRFRNTVRDIVRAHSAFDTGSGKRIVSVKLREEEAGFLETAAELPPDWVDNAIAIAEKPAPWEHPQNPVEEEVRTIHPKKAKKAR